LRHLVPLPRLQELVLRSTAVGDAALVHLGAMRHLSFVDLRSTRVSDRGRLALTRARAIETLPGVL
jgi:hypothetical protein